MVEYLLSTARAEVVREIIQSADADGHVPALCDIEVASALRRLLLTQAVVPQQALEKIAAYVDLPLDRHGHEALLVRALSLRDNFTVFDAVYVALAESLDATLVTADSRLARAVRAHLSLSLIEA